MNKLTDQQIAQLNLANGGLIPHQFHIKCTTCTYGKHVGDAPLTADTYATKHAIVKPGHVVELRDFEIVVKRFANQRPTIPDWLEPG